MENLQNLSQAESDKMEFGNKLVKKTYKLEGKYNV